MKEKKTNMHNVIRSFFLSLSFNVWLKKNPNLHYSVLCIINTVCVCIFHGNQTGEKSPFPFLGKTG